MALRTIRTNDDPVLTRKCKPVTAMTPRLRELIGDMLETMYEAGGVGLAAPQVGVLRRIVVIDVSEEEESEPIILINPVMLSEEGEQTGEEGCLSVPGMAGKVTRPEKVRVSGLNEDMEPVEYEGEGLLARAFCHELDHLEGKMYTSLVEGELYEVHYKEEGEDDQTDEEQE